MKFIVLLIATVLAKPHITRYRNKEYLIFSHKYASCASDAEKICHKYDAHLARITCPEERDFLASKIKCDSYIECTFIGKGCDATLTECGNIHLMDRGIAELGFICERSCQNTKHYYSNCTTQCEYQDNKCIQECELGCLENCFINGNSKCVNGQLDCCSDSCNVSFTKGTKCVESCGNNFECIQNCGKSVQFNRQVCVEDCKRGGKSCSKDDSNCCETHCD